MNCIVCKKEIVALTAISRKRTVCHSCSVKVRRHRIKKAAVAYKGGCCNRCGFIGDIESYDFHHLEDKKFIISNPNVKSWIAIQKELDKCELLCANCHRLEHREKSKSFYEYADQYFGEPFTAERFIKLNTGETKIAGDGKKRLIKTRYSSNKKCINCGKEINKKTKSMCASCYAFSRRRVNRPSTDVLIKEISETNFSVVGKKYGVSDNTIRKWIK